MENKAKYFKIPPVSLAKQKLLLDKSYSKSKCIINNGKLEWYAKVKPTVYSKEYDVKVEYIIGKMPKTWILNVDIDKFKAKKIPHKYKVNIEEKKIQICLFRPQYKEWTKSKFISNTIVPWTIEWLYFYEIWEITGKWQGGGEHPN